MYSIQFDILQGSLLWFVPAEVEGGKNSLQGPRVPLFSLSPAIIASYQQTLSVVQR